MNPTEITILSIALGIVINVIFIWWLQKFRQTDTYRNNHGGIIRLLKWEESVILKIQNKIGEPINVLGARVRNCLRLNPDRQFRLFLIAMILVISGQYIMRRSVPINSYYEINQTINNWLRVDVKYLGNVILGMTCTVIGGILFVISSYKTEILKRDHFIPLTQQDHPIPQKFHLSQWLIRFLPGSLIFALLLYRSSKFDLDFYDLIFWILSIGIISIAVFRYDLAAGVSFDPNLPLREIGVITLLLILGFLIGTYQLQEIPNILKGDEGNFFETARYIVLGDYRGSIFGFGVYSYPVVSSYIQAGILRIFGASLWGWRFASVLPAMLTVIPLYFIGRDLFNRWVGFIAALTYISSPYLLSFARLGYNNSQAILFVTLCIWLFYLGLKKNSLFFIFTGGVVAGLGFLTYTAGRLGLIILCTLLVYTILSSIRGKTGKRFLLFATLFFVLGWVLIATPHLVYGNNQNPAILRQKTLEGLFIQADYATGLFGEDAIFETNDPFHLDQYRLFYNPEIYGRLLTRGFLRSILAFQLDELNTNYFISSALAGPIAVIFFVIGIYAVLAHFWRSNSFLIFVWFGSSILLLSTISTYPPRSAHLVPVIPAMALTIGIGVYVSVDQLIAYLSYKNREWVHLRAGIILLICTAIMIAGTHQYFTVSPKSYRPDLEQVMSWGGLHNPKDTKFIYIYEQTNREDWKPYLFHLGFTAPQFDSVFFDDVLKGNVNWPSDKNLSIFIEEPQSEIIVPIILEQLDQVKLETFTNRYGNPIGKAIVRGTVHFSSSVPFLTGLQTLLKSKVMWLIWPLVGLELYLIYRMLPELRLWNLQAGSIKGKERSKDFPFVPGQRKSSIENSVIYEKSQTEIFPDQSNTIEFGIFFRLGIEKINRLFQVKIVINHQKEASSSQGKLRKNTNKISDDESDNTS